MAQVTRAEHFVMTNGAVWRVAKVAHFCDRLIRTPLGDYACRCKIEVGMDFLDTNVSKFPNVDSWDRRKHIKLRYCFMCANSLVDVLTHQEVPGKIVSVVKATPTGEAACQDIKLLLKKR